MNHPTGALVSALLVVALSACAASTASDPSTPVLPRYYSAHGTTDTPAPEATVAAPRDLRQNTSHETAARTEPAARSAPAAAARPILPSRPK